MGAQSDRLVGGDDGECTGFSAAEMNRSRAGRDNIFRIGGYRCVYCRLPFGTAISKHGQRFVLTKPTIDHKIPWSYRQDDSVMNRVPACHLCNGIKSALCFDRLSDARRYVMNQWADRNYVIVWSPSVSSEEDPETWAREFARFLSRSLRYDWGEAEDDATQASD